MWPRIPRLLRAGSAGTQSGVQVEHFGEAVEVAVQALRSGLDRDWSVGAGTLTWNCRETADHIVDVVFSYTLQLAAEAQHSYLPFGELHALPEAQPVDLVDAIAGVGRMFTAVMATASPGARAWHPFGLLSVTDWAGLGANEVVVHTFDIAAGLDLSFEPARALCSEILSDMLTLHGRPDGLGLNREPCSALLELSGRSSRD
jgi:hypothetical protein